MNVNYPSCWDVEAIYDKAEGYFEQLLLDMSLAHTSIVLETYIFQWDKLGSKFISTLTEASLRGVNVKVLIDGVGSFEDCGVIAKVLGDAGVSVKIFHPLPWRIDLYHLALTEKRWYAKLPYFLIELNRRDHRKLCVVDGLVAWVGSFNITESHLPESLGGEDFHDIAVRVEGGNVMRLLDDFYRIWFDRINAGKIKRIKYYLSNSGRSRRIYRNSFFLDVLKNSERRVWVFSAYFSPSDDWLEGLVNARSRGVDVKILVGARSDIVFFSAITKSYYLALLEKGVEVYEYQKGILHSKTILVDDKGYVGSANMNHRSYFHDMELDVILSKPDSIAWLEGKFEVDASNGLMVDRVYIDNVPLVTRLLGRFLLIFKNWL